MRFWVQRCRIVASGRAGRTEATKGHNASTIKAEPSRKPGDPTGSNRHPEAPPPHRDEDTPMTRTFRSPMDSYRARAEQARTTQLVNKTETPRERMTRASKREQEYAAALNLLTTLQGQLEALGGATLKSSCERTGCAPQMDPETEEGQLVNRVEDAACFGFFFEGLRANIAKLADADRLTGSGSR